MGLVLAATGVVSADPAISGVSANLQEGQPITIAGSDFGVKSPAAPLIWENFENGRNGADLIGWEFFRGTSQDYLATVNPTYSSAVLRAGNSALNGMMHTPGHQYDCAAYKRGLGRKHEIYASYNFYVDHSSGPESWNIKMLRLLPGSPNFKTGSPSISVTLGLDAFGIAAGGGTENALGYWGVPWTEERWHRWEYHLRASEPLGAPNGTAGLWIDTWPFKEFADSVTMNSEATQVGGQYLYVDTVVLPFYAANGDGPENNPGNVYKIYYDDLYVDVTLARVEVGDQPTWVACSTREIQIPTAWSDTGVSVTVNQGTFGYGSAYLFVVDSNGAASPGFPITFEPSSKRLAEVINRWQAGQLTRNDVNKAVYWYMKGTMPVGDPMAELTEEDIGNAIKLVGGQ